MAKLSLGGGRTVKKTVGRICTKMFAPHLAVKLNWCGRRGKKGVRDTRIVDLIVCKYNLSKSDL